MLFWGQAQAKNNYECLPAVREASFYYNNKILFARHDTITSKTNNYLKSVLNHFTVSIITFGLK